MLRIRPLILSAALVSGSVLGGCDAANPSDSANALAAATADGLAQNAQAKWEVCHRTSADTNEFVLIEVADPAFDTHLSHGDAPVGGDVPGQPGYVFDEACAPVASGPATCPCFTFVFAEPYTTYYSDTFDGSTGTLSLIGFDAYGVTISASGNSCTSPTGDDDAISNAEAAVCRGLLLEYIAENDIRQD